MFVEPFNIPPMPTANLCLLSVCFRAFLGQLWPKWKMKEPGQIEIKWERLTLELLSCSEEMKCRAKPSKANYTKDRHFVISSVWAALNFWPWPETGISFRHKTSCMDDCFRNMLVTLREFVSLSPEQRWPRQNCHCWLTPAGSASPRLHLDYIRIYYGFFFPSSASFCYGNAPAPRVKAATGRSINIMGLKL